MKALDVKALGIRISSYRERLGLSRKIFSELSGVKLSNLTKIENGRGVELNLEVINKIAETLKVTLDDLLIDSIDKYDTLSTKEDIMSIVDLYNETQMTTYLELLCDYKQTKEK